MILFYNVSVPRKCPCYIGVTFTRLLLTLRKIEPYYSRSDSPASTSCSAPNALPCHPHYFSSTLRRSRVNEDAYSWNRDLWHKTVCDLSPSRFKIGSRVRYSRTTRKTVIGAGWDNPSQLQGIKPWRWDGLLHKNARRFCGIQCPVFLAQWRCAPALGTCEAKFIVLRLQPVLPPEGIYYCAVPQ